MREILMSELSVLKLSISDAEEAVFIAYNDLRVAKQRLQAREDDILLDRAEGVKIDGKNAEIRAAQIREATFSQREGVLAQEQDLEASKLALAGYQTELRINLALVELVKGVA